MAKRNWQDQLPEWAQDWLEVIVPGGQILLILVAAWALQRLIVRVVDRAGTHYQMPLELMVPINGLLRWTILLSALLLVLERMGVSATVLWTAFTGFATVGAVAFFAAWSVLSNLFCALLIFTIGPFSLGDTIELLDTAEKPGAKGRVIDINLLYTTLEDSTAPGTFLQIPNSLIFQRVLRRWKGGQAVAASSSTLAPAAEVTPDPHPVVAPPNNTPAPSPP